MKNIAKSKMLMYLATLLIVGTAQADLLVHLTVPQPSGGIIPNSGTSGGFGVMDTGVIGIADEPYNVDVDSRTGYSLNFNGTANSRVDFGTDIAGLNVYTNRIVVAAWVKISDFTNNHHVVMASSAATGIPDGFIFSVLSNKRLDITYKPASQAALYANSGLALVGDNEWTHIAAKIDVVADTLTLYINGDKLYTKSISGANQIKMDSGVQLTLNRTPGSDSNLFKGLADDVRIYNNDMSDNDIAALFAPDPTNCGNPGTVYLDSDLSGPGATADCYVNYYDIEELAARWLECTDPAVSGCN